MSRALIAGVILGAGLISGGTLMQSGVLRQADAATGSVQLLEQVMARVRQNFLDSIPTDELFSRAAQGLVRELDDPHSILLTPEGYRRVRESASGRYPGIGVELDIRDGFLNVIAPLAGTPADSAGIKPGDRIVAIDTQPTVGLNMEEVQQALRGAAGSTVRLTIERSGSPEPLELTLRRREIVYHPVQRAVLLADGIGYVNLANFSEDAARAVRRAVDSLRRGGAGSLILDLRANPGGLFEQGIAVANLFLDSGRTIASTRGRRAEADVEFEDDSAQLWPGLRMVALVDSGTASAAEIVAGALQDHKRAVIIGSPTYGKGSAQSVFVVTGERALKLTTARWFTPNGRTIERDSTKGGISPDVTVRAPADGSDAALARAVQILTTGRRS